MLCRKWLFACVAISMLAGCEPDMAGLPVLLPGDAPKLYKTTTDIKSIKFTSPKELHVVHGHQCAKDEPAESGHSIGIANKIGLPNNDFIGGTVILNGWRFRFQDEETRIIGFAAALGPTTVDKIRAELRFQALGTIYTEDIKQAVEYCYYYTAIAWTDFLLNRHVVEESVAAFGTYRNSAHHTALMSAPRYLQSASFDGSQFVGVLPRGFALAWADYDDDYFLQAAYHMKPSARFIYDSLDKGLPVRRDVPDFDPKPALPKLHSSAHPVDLYDKGFVSWESDFIFKNGDRPDPFIFHDMAAGIAGDQLAIVEPPFGIRSVMQADIGEGIRSGSASFGVANLPHHFALPVLKGWNLSLVYDDEQIRAFGIWIEDFDYKRTSGKGLLTYKVGLVYEDDERSKAVGETGVSILGVNELFPD